ncbi:unnamed protein product, partial [Iphiclides podalirius]
MGNHAKETREDIIVIKSSQGLAPTANSTSENNNVTKNQIWNFLQNLPNLKDYSESVRNVSDLTKILSIMKKHYFTVESLMEEVHQKCDKLLLYCEFNRKAKNCGDIFKLIKTYEGHCCAFNYAALNDDSETADLAKDDDIEYFDDPSGEDVKTNARILVNSESGRGSGLSVIINVEPFDYPNWSSLPYFGAKILLSDPNDYPETTVLYKFVTLGESLDIKVEPMVFLCENNIRQVSPDKRNCWFHDEVLLEYTDRYSYETCKTECKMQNFLRNCGCVPYKYPIEISTPICEFENLECLNNVTAYKSEEDRACDPVCYMECWDKRYSITSDLTPLIPELFPANVTKDHNAGDLCALQVYFAKSSCNSYKLMLLIDFNYFIATYGEWAPKADILFDTIFCRLEFSHAEAFYRAVANGKRESLYAGGGEYTHGLLLHTNATGMFGGRGAAVKRDPIPPGLAAEQSVPQPARGCNARKNTLKAFKSARGSF